MADEILGHEHLDHGRHLVHHHVHSQRGRSGSLPKHIALGGDPHAHLHSAVPKHPYKSSHAHLHEHSSNHGPASGSHDNHGHGGHGHSHSKSFDSKRMLIWGLALIVIIPVLLLFYKSFSGLTSVLIVIIFNSALEYHKYFTEGVPLDLELIFLGAAYVTIVHGTGWGLLLAGTGPLIASAVRGHVCDVTLRKTIAALAMVLAASVLGPSRYEVAFAVLLGVAAHYGIIVASGASNGVSTIIARFTDLGLNVYLALFFLPLITGIA